MSAAASTASASAATPTLTGELYQSRAGINWAFQIYGWRGACVQDRSKHQTAGESRHSCQRAFHSNSPSDVLRGARLGVEPDGAAIVWVMRH
jgi:hypothetical protein